VSTVKELMSYGDVDQSSCSSLASFTTLNHILTTQQKTTLFTQFCSTVSTVTLFDWQGAGHLAPPTDSHAAVSLKHLQFKAHSKQTYLLTVWHHGCTDV